ncbi:Bcr/CflA family multidrug efflux MFS transporter [Paraburkholderia adhaesiva]|uniref:Bcr/CflA family multidrug efflux MFS transporter n=1 Tax=Paraburkholderia adhaesiva TaxID=2883244 RepID=UPI001F45EEAE|nr:Bcr/CflA family multidrug efflux MFS transporter [Paraburkholderia adhaesiva]
MTDLNRRRKSNPWLILLLGALAACGPFGTDIYLPGMPSIAASFGVPASAAAATLTSFIAGFSGGMLLYGPLSDAWGRRPVLLAGLVMFTGASLACWLANSIGQLMLMRFVQALGAGAASVLARTIARDAHEPDEASKVLSMVALVTSIGPLLAPLIGGQLLLLGTWRTAFIALMLFGMFCAVATYLWVPETWPEENRASGAVSQAFVAYGRLLGNPVVWGHLLVGGMTFAALFTYITETPFVYIQYFHISPQHYGLFFAFNVLGIMIGNILNARLVGRLGTLRMISASSAISVVASLFVVFVCLTGWGGLWTMALGLCVVIGQIGILTSNCMTDLMSRYSNNAGAAAALFGATQLAFGALASFIVGQFSHASPAGIGYIIGVTGMIGYGGKMLIVRVHALHSAAQAVPTT